MQQKLEVNVNIWSVSSVIWRRVTRWDLFNLTEPYRDTRCCAPFPAALVNRGCGRDYGRGLPQVERLASVPGYELFTFYALYPAYHLTKRMTPSGGRMEHKSFGTPMRKLDHG